ncbi:MAG: hypothetical protein RBR08_00885 [Desulforegulaceae bacterium]|nr:hypothetical protein [Desulforegulaceae bacterium]
MLEIESLDEVELIKPKKFSDVNKFSCSGKDLELILAVKGAKDQKKLMEYLKKLDDSVSAVINLEYLNLIEVTKKKKNFHDSVKENKPLAAEKRQIDSREILFYVESKLLEAVGPIGNVIFEDCVDDMGEKKKTFPLKRIPELINILSKEIPRDDKRKEFQMSMILKLKELKMA